MKDKTIKIKIPNTKHSLNLYIHESSEKIPSGLIIDVYDENMEAFYDSYIIDYDSVRYDLYEDDEQ